MVSMDGQTAMSANTNVSAGRGSSTSTTASTTPTASPLGESAVEAAMQRMLADAMHNQRIVPGTTSGATENNSNALLTNVQQIDSASPTQPVPGMRILGVNRGLAGTATAASDMLLMKELASRAKFSHPSKPKKTKPAERRVTPMFAIHQQPHHSDVVVPAPPHAVQAQNNTQQTKQLSRVSTPDASLVLTDDEANKVRRSLQKSSGYRGVSKCAKDGRWQARIRIGHVVKYLGRFRTEPEAARCYDEAARKFHGSRAVVNFGNAPLEVGEVARPTAASSSAAAASTSAALHATISTSSSQNSSTFRPTNGSSKRERQAEARKMVEKVAAARAAVIAAAGEHVPRRRSSNSSTAGKTGANKTKINTAHPKHPVRLASKASASASTSASVKTKTKRRSRKNTTANEQSTSATSALSALLSHPALPQRAQPTNMAQTQQQLHTQALSGGLTLQEQQQRQHQLLLANMYGARRSVAGNHMPGTPYDLPMASLLQHHYNNQQQHQQQAAMYAYTHMYMQQQQQQQQHPHLPPHSNMVFSSNAEQAAFLAAATVAANSRLPPQQQQQLAAMLVAQHTQQGLGMSRQPMTTSAPVSASASRHSSPPLPARQTSFPAPLFGSRGLSGTFSGGAPVVPVSLAPSSPNAAQEGKSDMGKAVKTKKRKSSAISKVKMADVKKKKKKERVGLKQAVVSKSKTKTKKKNDKSKVKASVDPASLDEAAKGLIFLMSRPE